MGITQRTIKTLFNSNSSGCQTRKRTASKPITVGDWLHLKRIEGSLSQTEIAEHVGVRKSKVRAWEHDAEKPTDTEWQALSSILPMDTGIPKPKPTVDHGVGNYTVGGIGSQTSE